MSSSILTDIIRKKQKEISALPPLEELQRRCKHTSPAVSFTESIRNHSPLAIIAEVKKASPSKGVFAKNLDPINTAIDYEKNGAAGISILTDQYYFKGNIEYIKETKKAGIKVPILRKDFIISKKQVLESKLIKSDAILLIASVLDDKTLKELFLEARQNDLEVLVEVHDEREACSAIELYKEGGMFMGINNRNLHTFETSVETSIEILSSKKVRDALDEGLIAISESGISSSTDMSRLSNMGAHGFLIGEHLIKSGNPGTELARLLRACRKTGP